jgi:hypothetical protein
MKPCTYQGAVLATLKTTVDFAMHAIVESYPELHRERRLDDSPDAVTAAKLVDQCARLLAALAEHRRHLARPL